MGEKRGQDRRSLRLQDYDYTRKGAYFITLLTKNRACIFGNVVGEKVKLSEYGEIAREEWLKSNLIRQEIQLFENELVIMPNHLHGIVWIRNSSETSELIETSSNGIVGATGRSPLRLGAIELSGPRPKSLGAFVMGFKGAVTRRLNEIGNTPGNRVWIRNYHDRVIRNERELKAIRKYIRENPLNWELDWHYSFNNS